MSIRLDLPTVLLLYNTSLVAGALSLYQLSHHSCRPQGLRHIVAAFLMLAIGSVMAWTGEHAALPVWLWTHLSLALGTFSYTLLWAGMREFSGRRAVPWKKAFLPATASVVVGLVTEFPLENILRAGVFHMAAVLCLAASALEVLRDRRVEPLPSRAALGFFLGLSAAVYALQLAMMLSGHASPLSFSWGFYVQMFCHFGMALVAAAISNERGEIRLAQVASTDPLTGVGNRRWMDMRLPRRLPAGSALLQLDIDRFKQINDRYGHPAGDRVLVAFARCLRARLRDTDLLARMGGEEFVIYLPAIDRADAQVFAERLRASVETLRVEDDGQWIAFTVSIGVAWLDAAHVPVGACLKAADEALYKAKHAGRNQVVMADPVKDPGGGAAGTAQSRLEAV